MFYELCCPCEQIGDLCAESFCERIFSVTNDVCHDGNTLLDTEEINMLVVLHERVWGL